MRRRLALLATFIVLLVVVASDGWAFSFQLTRVADTSTPIPGGSGKFVGFLNTVALSGGNVAFLGFGSSVSQGIYLFDGGVLTRVADVNTPIPGGSGTFTSFNPPVLSGSNVAFDGFGSFGGQEGLYLFESGVLTRVVDRNTPIPGGNGTFTGGFRPALSGGNVAFRGDGSAGQEGIYLFEGGALTRVADLNTPIPGGNGTFTSLDFLPALSGGNVAFTGFGSSGQGGIYLFDGGVLTRVADRNTPIPGGSGDFITLTAKVLSGGNVAFQGFGTSGQVGIYFFEGGALTQVADLNTPIPNGNGNFTGVNEPALSGGNVAFRGSGSIGEQGIYLAMSSAPPGPTAPIPTLSTLGIAIMMAFLTAVSVSAIRRRST